MEKFTTEQAFSFYDQSNRANKNRVTCEIKAANKPLIDSLLDMNSKNRSVKPRLVEKYCGEILRGKWLVTNQGIGVTEDGVLADGQHRLLAIKKCGYPPVQLLLVCGLSDDVRLVVDQQAKRSMRDILHFAFDHRVSHIAPAIATVLLRNIEKKPSQDITPSVVLECIEKYLDEIEYVVSLPKSKNFFAAPFLAGFIYSLWDLGQHIEKEAIEKRISFFMNQVETGEMLTKTDPAFHLRNYLVSTKKNSGGHSIQTERFAKTLKAFYAFVEGKKMGVLRA